MSDDAHRAPSQASRETAHALGVLGGVRAVCHGRFRFANRSETDMPIRIPRPPMHAFASLGPFKQPFGRSPRHAGFQGRIEDCGHRLRFRRDEIASELLGQLLGIGWGRLRRFALLLAARSLGLEIEGIKIVGRHKRWQHEPKTTRFDGWP